jgi:hypothetical protein
MLIAVLLGMYLIIAEGLAAPQRPASGSERIGAERSYTPAWARRAKADANSVPRGPNFLADSNAIKSKIKAHPSLEKDLDNLTKGGKLELREWTTGPVEEKMALAHTVHKQLTAELGLIRKLAQQEGASKTLAAIDAVMLDRQNRFGEVSRKVEAARNRMRRAERRARGYRGGGRYMRGRYPDAGQYPQDEMDAGMYRERGAYRDRGTYRDRNMYRNRNMYRDRRREGQGNTQGGQGPYDGPPVEDERNAQY